MTEVAGWSWEATGCRRSDEPERWRWCRYRSDVIVRVAIDGFLDKGAVSSSVRQSRFLTSFVLASHLVLYHIFSPRSLTLIVIDASLCINTWYSPWLPYYCRDCPCVSKRVYGNPHDDVRLVVTSPPPFRLIAPSVSSSQFLIKIRNLFFDFKKILHFFNCLLLIIYSTNKTKPIIWFHIWALLSLVGFVHVFTHQI